MGKLELDMMSSHQMTEQQVIEAVGLPIFEVSGFEADDVIATVVAQARERGLGVVIVSADKDLLQLVGDPRFVRSPGRERLLECALRLLGHTRLVAVAEHQVLEALPFFLGFDLTGYPPVLASRHENRVSTRQRNKGRQHGTFFHLGDGTRSAFVQATDLQPVADCGR